MTIWTTDRCARRLSRHARCTPRVAAGGGAADAAEQPRPGGRRASGGARRLRRHRQGRARLGELRRDRAHARPRSRATRRCSCSPASRSACMRTHEWAPRVLIANSNLVGDWANWDEFRRLEALGLTMYGQMTAGSWIYIGTQGILQGTFETFAAVADQRFGGTLAGTITLTGGLGGMGGAQPLAVTMNGGVAICVDVDPQPHRPPPRAPLPRRRGARSWMRRSSSPSRPATPSARSRSACSATPRSVFPQLLAMDAPIDIVTDQTSAHDPLAYLAARRRVRRLGRGPQGPRLRATAPASRWRARSRRWSGSSSAGAEVFDYGNNIRTEALTAGLRGRVRVPRVRARLHPSAVRARARDRSAGRRSAATPSDIAKTDRAVLELFPENASAAALDPARAGARALPGPARPHLLARLRRARSGGLTVQRHGRVRRGAGSDRDRPRPPRLRLRRIAVPRDRGDARRLGRDRRLAAAQRAREHRIRGDLGLDPPRRRRRDRAFASTPGRCRSPTARRSRRRSSSGCSPTTPGWA